MPRKTIVDADQVAESQLILRDVSVDGVNELDVVYYDSSNYVPAIATGLSTGANLGIAYNVSGGTADVSTAGLMSGFTSLSAGSIYYLSDSSAGQITGTPPTTKIPIGIAVSSTELMLIQGGWTTLYGGAEKRYYFDGYDSAGDTDVSSGWTDVPLGTKRVTTSGFTHTPGDAEITFVNDGTYIVVARLTTYVSSGTSRSESELKLQIDTGGGYADVPGTTGINYNRTADQGAATSTVMLVLGVSAGTKLKMQGRRVDGGSTVQTLANGSGITIWNTAISTIATVGELNDIEDVDVPAPNNGEVLVYNNSTGNWEAAPLEDDRFETIKAPNGFENRTDSTFSFTPGTLTFSIQPVATDYTYWIVGTEYVKTGTDNVVITDTDGLWFFYFNGGTLSATQIFAESLIVDYALVAIMWWDSTLGDYILLGDERHGYIMDGKTHQWGHSTLGSMWDTRDADGLALVNITADGDGDDAEDAEIGVNDGYFWDEDIDHFVEDGSPQTLRAVAQLPVWYFEGTRWKVKAADDYPVIYNGSVSGYSDTRIAYNSITAGVGSLVEAGNGDYVLCPVMATNDIETPVIAFCGQGTYKTRRLAMGAVSDELDAILTSGLPLVEGIVLGVVLFQTGTAYANTPKARVRYINDDDAEYLDLRSLNLGPGAGTSTLNNTDSIPRTIVVAPEGGDYNSIEEGCLAAAALVPTASDPVGVVVHAGYYTENALTVPAYTTLTTVSGPGSAVINAATATDTLVTIGAFCTMSGFVVSGASGTGGTGVSVPSTASNFIIKELIIFDCETGIKIAGTGTPSSIIGNILTSQVTRAPGQVCVTGIDISAGALVLLSAFAVFGTPASLITTGVKVTGSIAQFASGSVNFCTTGCEISGMSVTSQSATHYRACTTAVAVDDATTNVKFNAAVIEECTTDLDLRNAGVTGYFNGSLDPLKTNIEDADGFFMSSFSEKPGEGGLKVVGDLDVGRHNRASHSAFGNGGPTIEGQYVFTNTNQEAGTWADITDDATTIGDTFNFLPGTGAGNCIYIGVGHPFPALRIEALSTALNVGTGSVVAEYWTGAAWVAVYVMETRGCTSYANNLLSITGTDITIRMGVDADSWSLKTLDGQSAYWARMRVVTAITTVPVASRMLHFYNATSIDHDGYVTFMGEAKPIRGIPITGLVEVLGFAALNEGINAGPNTGLALTDNQRSNSAKDGSGGFFTIPNGLDTSRPIIFTIGWYPDDDRSGNVETEIYICRKKPGDEMDGTLPEVIGSTIDSITGQGYLEQQTDVGLYISDALPGETFYWSHIRDASSGNPDDTYPDHIYLTSWSCAGTFWR